MSHGWTQKSKIPIPTDHAGQQEQRVGRGLRQLRQNWLAGCIRHTHWFRHHLLLRPNGMKARPSSLQVHPSTGPTHQDQISQISHHARIQELRHLLSRKPTSQGTQHPTTE